MALELVRAKMEHVPEIARIIFEAFKGVSEEHGFPLDIPALEVALGFAPMVVGRPDFYGVTAILDGKIVGSNFVMLSDAVAGVGPITVDTSCQGRGVGRALMQQIVDWSLKNHGPMVRLMQDGFNMRSLSLYTALGFRVVEPIVMMDVPPAAEADVSVRKLSAADVAACETLCQRVLKVSRKNEAAVMIDQGEKMGFVPHGRFKGDKLVSYFIPGFLGHGVAESAEDLLVLATQSARNVPPSAHKMFVPARNGGLLQNALRRGLRSVKLMSLMAMGPYEKPLEPETGAAWGPSISY